MRTATRIGLATATVLALSATVSTPAQAATVGNVICNNGASTRTLKVDYGSASYVILSGGQCSKPGAQALNVRIGTYCISKWGTIYDGPSGWWLGLEYRRYPVAGNYVSLWFICR